MDFDRLAASSTATASNLDFLDSQIALLLKRRRCELVELAKIIAEKIKESVSQGLSVFDSLCLVDDFQELDGEQLIGSNDTDSDSLNFDRAEFSSVLCSELYEIGVDISESDFLTEFDVGQRFTYVKNILSDEAFDVFSQEFDDPRVRYSNSFKDCCTALVNGDADFCLLPLEEKDGARLGTTSDMIYRYDFKINAVTPVFGMDNTEDLKFALISKSFRAYEPCADDDRYLELRLLKDNDSLLRLSYVIKHFKMSLYRADTLSFDNEGGSSTYYSVVVRDNGMSFAPLLVYTTLFENDCVAIGLYKNLE